MARQESFTYGALVVGGASATYPSEIKDRFGISESIDAEGNAFAEFVCQFVVTGTTATLPTNCKAVEAALNLYRQKLSMNFGAVNQIIYNPNVAGGETLGFDAAPSLRKLEDATSTGLSRGYEFRVRIMLPVLLSGQDYRRTSLTTLHYDVTDRQTVMVTGNYTASPNNLARATMLANIDAFIDARIIAYFGGPPTTEWAVTSRDEPSNDPNTVASFSRVYSQHVGGRRSETIGVTYGPARLRIVSIQGVYIRTPGSPLSVSADTATGNYSANQADASTDALAALSPPLTVGTDVEITTQSFTPNEQNDRLDFSETWRELLFKQSPEASDLNDPSIISDEVTFFRAIEALDDSPLPTPVASGDLKIAGPPSGALPGGSTRTRASTTGAAASPSATSGNSTGSTRARAQAGGGAGNGNNGGGTVSPPTGAPTPVRKWVTLGINYSASISKGQNLRLKWDQVLQPYLLSLMASRLGLGPTFVVSIQPEFNATDSTIKATILAKGIESSLFALQVFDTQADDLGLRLDPAFTGSPHAYLVQQGLPRRTKQRRMVAFSQVGGGFSLASLASGSQIPGWVKVSESTPNVSQRVIGAFVPGIGQLSALHESLIEDFVWVAENVAGAAGNNAAAGANGGSAGSARPAGQTNQGGGR